MTTCVRYRSFVRPFGIIVVRMGKPRTIEQKPELKFGIPMSEGKKTHSSVAMWSRKRDQTLTLNFWSQSCSLGICS